MERMITRTHLENWMSLPDARNLVNKFFGNRDTYPDYDFYSRKRGINKDIPEEFYPLLMLAERLPTAVSIRLSPSSLSGPDGAILLKDKSEITVQVTVSYERSDTFKIRHYLRDHGTWSSGVFSPKDVIKQRLERIINSVKDKEINFRQGTDVLLIVEQSTKWADRFDLDLHEEVGAAFDQLPTSKYSAIYVVYGTDIRKLR
jgi:hypothetical protein